MVKLFLVIGLLLSANSTLMDRMLLLKIDNGSAVEVNLSDYNIGWFGFPMMNQKMLKSLTDELSLTFYKSSKNAGLDENGKIIPEVIGYRVDKKRLKEFFTAAFFDNGISEIMIPTIPVYPKVDSEIIASIRSKLIGHYITFYNHSNRERSLNISLAVQAINNQVVFPGEVFSFNHVVGKRTAAKGYKPAPVIVRGELSEGIGGGICQVSSTLYNAVDQSGLKIIERYSHSKSVPYVPPGRDATVSWYGPDFIFKNNYNRPILIRAKSFHGNLVVFIYSADDLHSEHWKKEENSNS